MSLTLDSILSFVFRPRIKEHLIKMLMHTHVCVCVDQLSFFRPKRDLMDCFLFPILVVLTFSTMIKACVLLIHPQKNKKRFLCTITRTQTLIFTSRFPIKSKGEKELI